MRDVSELVARLRSEVGQECPFIDGTVTAGIWHDKLRDLGGTAADAIEAQARENAALTARAEAAEGLLANATAVAAALAARAEAAEAKVARLAHLLGRQASWVNAALKCQAWQWDVDQREVAEDELAEARAALAEIGGGK